MVVSDRLHLVLGASDDGGTRHHFELAGELVEVVTNGDDGVGLVRGLAHLKVEAGERSPSLSIKVAISSDPPIETMPDSNSADRWLISDGGDCAYIADGQLHYLGSDNRAVWWARQPLADHPWEASRPFHLIIDWWATRRNLNLVHAGAVSAESGAALVVGPGGSGKSTTCLSCAGMGLGYIADDYCLVSSEPTPNVYSLYSTGKADQFSVSLLDHLDLTEAPIRPDGKATIYLHDLNPTALRRSAPLTTLIVPKVEPRATSTVLTQISSMSALTSLAPSSLLQLPGTSTSKLTELAAIVSKLNCYSLSVGRDISSIPRAIREAIES